MIHSRNFTNLKGIEGSLIFIKLVRSVKISYPPKALCQIQIRFRLLKCQFLNVNTQGNKNIGASGQSRHIFLTLNFSTHKKFRLKN